MDKSNTKTKKAAQPEIETAQELTPDAARAMLMQEKAERERHCLEAVQAVLDQYQCQLMAEATITPDGRIAARVVLGSR